MINVIDRPGADPALVFSHGLGDDHTGWDRQVAHFEGRHRLLLWDLPGHGASPAPSTADECTRDAALAHLQGVVRRVPGPVVLVGHSLGGYLSLAYALRRADDVQALVLAATGPGFRDPDARRRWNEYSAQSEAWFPDAPHVANLVRQPDSEVIDGLGRLDVPVLLVVGEGDRLYRDGVTYMARKLPRARSVVIEDAGHHPHQSAADAFNRAMDEFLGGLSVRP